MKWQQLFCSLKSLFFGPTFVYFLKCRHFFAQAPEYLTADFLITRLTKKTEDKREQEVIRQALEIIGPTIAKQETAREGNEPEMSMLNSTMGPPVGELRPDYKSTPDSNNNNNNNNTDSLYKGSNEETESALKPLLALDKDLTDSTLDFAIFTDYRLSLIHI